MAIHPRPARSAAGAAALTGRLSLRTEAALTLLFAIVGPVLRLVHLALLDRADPLLLAPVVDAWRYHTWAIEILTDPIGDQVFYQAPAYPYFVAAIYAIAGVSPLAVAVVQAVLSAAGALLCGDVAERTARDLGVSSSRWARPIAAAAWALAAPLIFHSALLGKIEPELVCLLGALDSFLVARARGRVRWFALSGACLGLGGLFQGNALVVAPLLAFVAFIDPLLHGDRIPRARVARVGIARTAAFALGVVLSVSPVTIRNYLVSGDFILTNYTSGAVAYEGNNPYSPYGAYRRLPFQRPHPRHEEEDMRVEAERRTGRPLRPSEVSAFWWSEALRYSLREPAATARRLLHKTGQIVQSYELPDNYSFEFHAGFSPVLRFTLPHAVLLALAAGAPVAATRLGALTPLLVYSLGWAASLLLFYVRSRYRVPILAGLVPLGAVTLVALAELIRGQRTRRVAATLATVLAVLIVSVALGAAAQAEEDPSHFWVQLANNHHEAGDRDGARALFDRALEENASNPLIWLNLGRSKVVDDPAAGLEACGRALELEPTLADARECVAYAHLRRGSPDEGLDALAPLRASVMPHGRTLLLAELLIAASRRGDAREVLDGASRRFPGSADVRELLDRLGD